MLAGELIKLLLLANILYGALYLKSVALRPWERRPTARVDFSNGFSKPLQLRKGQARKVQLSHHVALYTSSCCMLLENFHDLSMPTLSGANLGLR